LKNIERAVVARVKSADASAPGLQGPFIWAEASHLLLAESNFARICQAYVLARAPSSLLSLLDCSCY